MPLTPIVCVVGKSDVGKTTFLEKLIPELVSRGLRIGTIKHDAHGFALDTPGKDTWRHAQAGSRAVAISGPGRVAVLLRDEREATLDEVAERIDGEADLILVEGYKRSDKPKIEICRAERGRELLCSASELVCLVTDAPSALAVPQFGLDDAAGVADLLESSFLRPANSTVISLALDGRPVEVPAHLADALRSALDGIVRQFPSGSEAREVTVRVRRND